MKAFGKCIKRSLPAAATLVTAFATGCADFQAGGNPFGAYSSYRGGGTVYGRNEVVYVQPQPVVAQGPSASLPSVQDARTQTGVSYADGMAKLRSWNATQREREIDAYLARRPEFKSATRQARTDLKAQLDRWDKTLAERRDLVTRIGGDLAADSRYSQFVQSRAQTQARLDQIDASLVAAMLEDNAGAAARSMSWTAEKARSLDLVARNASAAEAAERARTDAAFGSAIY